MPSTFWQSTDRANRTLEYRQIGRRAYLLNNQRLAEVSRRQERGRSLAAAIRQFDADEIDVDDLRQEIDQSAVNPSRVNGYLGRLIAEHFCVCDDCDSLELQDECLVYGDRKLCESCQDNYF